MSSCSERALRSVASVFVSVSLFVPQSAFSAPKKGGILQPAANEMFTVEADGKLMTCALDKRKGVYVPGTLNVRKGRVTPLSVTIKARRQALKNASSESARRKAKKRLKAAKRQQQAFAPLCAAGGPTPPDGQPGGGPLPSQFSMAPFTGQVNDAILKRMLAKIAFGYSTKPGSVEQLFMERAKSKGLSNAVTWLLTPRPRDPVVFNRMLDRADNTLGNLSTQPRQNESIEGYRRGILDYAINAEDPFTISLWQFLWGFWTVGAEVLTNNPAENPQRKLWQDYMLFLLNVAEDSRIRNFTRDMMIHPMMLIWLDNRGNKFTVDPVSGEVQAAVNENFARELKELYSTAPERVLNCDTGERALNYLEERGGNRTRGDVYRMALALSGWDVAPLNVGGTLYWRGVFSNADKYPNTVTLFEGTDHARSINDENDVVEALFNHPGTPQFLAKELLRHFLVSEPPCQLVQSFAEVLVQKDFNLRESLKVLFLSTAFHHAFYNNKLALDPFRVVVKSARQLGLQRGREGEANVERLMLIPNRESELSGETGLNFNIAYPRKGVFWFDNTVFGESNTAIKLGQITYNMLGDETRLNEADWNPFELFVPSPQPGAQVATSLEVVRHVANLLGLRINQSQEFQLTQYLDNTMNGSGVLNPSLFDARNPDHKIRLKRMIWVLLQLVAFRVV